MFVQTLNENTNRLIDKKSIWLVSLLFLSCIVASVLLWKVEPAPRTQLTSAVQLDSLILLTLNNHDLNQNQIRTRSIEIDSIFTRNIYTVRVPPEFSKTSFHYALHQNVLPYRVKTVGRVEFPERNLQIHLLVNDKVHRSVFMNAE